MEKLKNPQIWLENFGEIMLFEDEFFWMIPDIFIFTYESCLASPYFSFDQEQWRLVLMPSDGTESILKNNDHWGLFLYIKSCNTPKQKYKVRLSLKTPDGKEKCSHTGELDVYYGFGKWDFLRMNSTRAYTYGCSLSGRMKICCGIERIEDDPSDLNLSKYCFYFNFDIQNVYKIYETTAAVGNFFQHKGRVLCH